MDQFCGFPASSSEKSISNAGSEVVAVLFVVVVRSKEGRTPPTAFVDDARDIWGRNCLSRNESESSSCSDSSKILLLELEPGEIGSSGSSIERREDIRLAEREPSLSSEDSESIVIDSRCYEHRSVWYQESLKKIPAPHRNRCIEPIIDP